MISLDLQPHRTARFGRAAALSGALFIGMIAPAWAGQAAPVQPGAWCAPRCGALVSSWSLMAYQTIRADNGYQNPLPASRAIAMMHIGMHDAVNAVTPRFATYAATVRDEGADPGVAAVAAAHGILLGLYPAQQALLDAELSKNLLDAGVGDHVERGLALGKKVAAEVLAKRAQDGSTRQESFREGERAGEYRFVPGSRAIVGPHWRSVQPFSLHTPSQFRTAPPPALASAEYARAFEEVKAFGGKGSTARSFDQSHYAAFWYELSDIGWNRVARVAVAERDLGLWGNARLFALLNMAMADAYIAGWDSKIFHNFWRPVTAIREAANDGNAQTQADASWESFLPTPPIQDHPSTHSALGAAAAAVLTELVGDNAPFAMTSPSAMQDNPVRRFASFREAARENAESRVMAGLHFRFAIEAGLAMGERIGSHTVATHLTPAPLN